MFVAVVVVALAGGAVVGSQIPASKAQLNRVGPAIEKSVANATGGRFDPRNYTYNAMGKPIAFNRIH